MPIIHIAPEEELKVFDELREAGPITALYPGDILIVQKAHLKVLDDAEVQYTMKDRDAIRQSRIEWEEQKKRGISLMPLSNVGNRKNGLIRKPSW